MSDRSEGILTAAFTAACVGAAASVVGVAVGLTAAPAILPAAAVVAASSIVVGGISGPVLVFKELKKFWNMF